MTNCIGIIAFSKTGKRVDPSARSARTFAVLVTTADGREFMGEADADKLGTIARAGRVLRFAGKPSTWDSDVLDLFYAPVAG